MNHGNELSRRHLLQRGIALSAGFAGLSSLMTGAARGTLGTARLSQVASGAVGVGYGPLIKDPVGIFDLPAGFTYTVISRRGDKMSDGLYVPGQPDAMAAFPGPRDNTVVIVRNHELRPDANTWSAFGKDLELLDKVEPARIYDRGSGKVPACGGTTNIVYNTKDKRVEREFLSLAGTINNCAGGATPWGTWLTCEEDTTTPGMGLEKLHGYVFEVPATEAMEVTMPRPIKEMGRFRHEACSIDPRSGVVYLTEDHVDGLLYRFIPKNPHNLHVGGRLQALVVQERLGLDTSNAPGKPKVELGKPMAIAWMDLEDIDSPKDDLRHRYAEKGAAIFARNEGMWYGNEGVYFAATTGGSAGKGQLWKYVPSAHEGTPEEKDAPGMLELFVEPNDSSVIENADNVAVAPWGELFLCEDEVGDGDDENYVVGVTPKGQAYRFAKNAKSKGEVAGAVFSPDGSTMFVNMQNDGLTLAIVGPWKKQA